jgi:hypothetical protein
MVNYRIKLYSFFRLQYEGYDSEKGIEIQGKQEMSIEEILQFIGIKNSQVSILTVNDVMIKERDALVKDRSTVCIFPLYPSGG